MISFFPSRAIALTLGPLDVHWYGVMYAAAFVVGYWLLKKLLKYRNLSLSTKEIDRLFLWIILGVILGGRLGFVFFYGGAEFLSDPIRILKIWEGGMSSHGGFVGVMTAVIFFCKRHHISLLALADVLVIPAALGLAFGRLGNLINAELYGTITSMPWAMSFPGVEGLRHPTQIYAILKNLTIFAITLWHLVRTAPGFVAGRTTALFFLLYGLLRFAVEHFREQPYAGTDVFGILLTRGQILTIPVLLLGVGLLLFVSYRRSGS